jgi:hypothetical protein
MPLGPLRIPGSIRLGAASDEACIVALRLLGADSLVNYSGQDRETKAMVVASQSRSPTSDREFEPPMIVLVACFMIASPGKAWSPGYPNADPASVFLSIDHLGVSASKFRGPPDAAQALKNWPSEARGNRTPPWPSTLSCIWGRNARGLSLISAIARAR